MSEKKSKRLKLPNAYQMSHVIGLTAFCALGAIGNPAIEVVTGTLVIIGAFLFWFLFALLGANTSL